MWNKALAVTGAGQDRYGSGRTTVNRSVVSLKNSSKNSEKVLVISGYV